MMLEECIASLSEVIGAIMSGYSPGYHLVDAAAKPERDEQLGRLEHAEQADANRARDDADGRTTRGDQGHLMRR